MKNKDELNGKRKITNKSIGCDSRNKVAEPILDTDINPKLMQFSNNLLEKYQMDGTLNQIQFFLGLSHAFGRFGWSESPNKILFKPMIDRYNSLMLQYQIMGEVVENMKVPFPMVYDDLAKEKVIGKYLVSIEHGIPQFLFHLPETHEQFAERLIASSLLDFIYELVDIRKIENSIPELNGLCNYLKKLAPNEFYAYCRLGDQTNFNAPLDLDGYREFMEQIEIASRVIKN